MNLTVRQTYTITLYNWCLSVWVYLCASPLLFRRASPQRNYQSYDVFI